MTLFLVSALVLGLSALLALTGRRHDGLAVAVGSAGAVLGGLLGLVPATRAALGAPAVSCQWAWALPGGALRFELDALSGFFLIPTLLLAILAAVYGVGYLRSYRGQGKLGPAWCCFNLLVLSMALVITARNAILFLLAWETMALVSFGLVVLDHEQATAREAGWLYLVATHLGTALLLVMFVIMGEAAGSYDFGAIQALGAPVSEPVATALPASLLFVLAVLGFGTKAGIVPLHVWLPEAHPAAPSHVSALMSGVMIKTGIYGLLRTLTLLNDVRPWWGWVLVAVGVSSGLMGVLLALAQHDLKRLLAYHSVENVGIITLGLGLGVLGLAHGADRLAVLGFAGALLHVLNHALFKGLLFLGAGSVLHSAGTRDIEHLGGLLRRMPWTGASFLIGAAAISGLPPLNGFLSEALVYLAAFGVVAKAGPVGLAVAAVTAIVGLALIGGLALACFAKAFGIVFLGEPRSARAKAVHEAGWSMRLPQVVLAGLCVLIGVLPLWLVPQLASAVACAGRLPPNRVALVLDGTVGTLGGLTLIAALAVLLAVVLLRLRRGLLRGRVVASSPTWDCGYARPTARMQYTASGFAQPLMRFFGVLLGTRRTAALPEGLFPGESRLTTNTPDPCHERLFGPLFRQVAMALSRLRGLQHGRIQMYLCYIVLALLALILWKLR
jgi:formate hydrogenlyase subunit 3/multisubunit Na+/H+ antiporter MnhD subunit